MEDAAHESLLLGCLLGTAVGDSIGLPSEGLSRQQIADRSQGQNLDQSLVFGRGMLSDDTEHTVIVARALARCSDTKSFQAELMRSLRWWLVAIPAGVGLATARSILKMWCGFPADKSGVKSAGNGAAMRSAIIGVHYHNDAELRMAFTRASAEITHTDERAVEAAILVAEAAALAYKNAATEEVLVHLEKFVRSEKMRECFDLIKTGIATGIDLDDFTKQIGCYRAVTGFAPLSVAVAIFSWLRYRGDFRSIISSIVVSGGDTDTVAAIAGAITGIETGEQNIPKAWVERITDWPVSITYIRKLAKHLSVSDPGIEPYFCSFARPIRNVFFLLVVISHGVIRLFRSVG